MDTWQPQQDLSNYTGASVHLTDNVPRTYTVTVTSASHSNLHCELEIKVNDPAFSRPVFDTHDTVTCANQPLMIGGTNVAGFTYSWGFNGLSDIRISNPVATILVYTQFPVLVTAGNGCELRDTVSVSVGTVNVAAGDDWVICNSGVVKLGTPAQPNTSYTWEPQIASAYLYQLREQLLMPAPWEHVSLNLFGLYNHRRRHNFFNRYKEELEEIANSQFLSEQEKTEIAGFNNKATQLLDKQTQVVQLLFQRKVINSMQQINLQAILNSFFDEQGKAERIENFPFPRKYAACSFIFVSIFIFLLPFGIVGEFSKLGDNFVWLSVPLGVVVGWIYVVMELIGDYSENPFEGLHHDIPMLSICRTIEIDMLQMLGEKNIPKPIQPKGEQFALTVKS